MSLKEKTQLLLRAVVRKKVFRMFVTEEGRCIIKYNGHTVLTNSRYIFDVLNRGVIQYLNLNRHMYGIKRID